MVYRRKLTKDQVSEIKDAVRTKKCMEVLVDMCAQENICKRMTVFNATDTEKYDPENPLHRLVLDAAVRLLQAYDISFSWAIQETETYTTA